MAKISTLQDNFDDNSLGSEWYTSVGGGATHAETGQESVHTPQPATSGSFADMFSTSSYDCSNDEFYIQFKEGASPQCDSYLCIYSNTGDRICHLWDNGDVVSYTYLSAVGDYRTYQALAPSSSTWLRIRESSGTIYWDYSTNGGGSWSTYDSMSTPISVTNVQVQFGVYEWSTPSSPGQTIFDSFNSLSAPTLSINVSDIVSIAEDIGCFVGEVGGVIITVNDSLGITEAVSATEVSQYLFISVYDEVGVSPYLSLNIYPLNISFGSTHLRKMRYMGSHGPTAV